MRKSYAYHKPTEDGLAKMRDLRKAYSDLHDLVESLVSHSRERSIALTELEASAMWAIKAVVCNDSGSVVES